MKSFDSSTVAWLPAASLVGGFANSLAGTGGALLVRQVGGSTSAAGLPQSLLVIGGALTALLLAPLTRRRGRGGALATGATLAAAGCLVTALSGGLGSLAGVFGGSLLLGGGNTAVMLSRYAAADLVSEERRARAMSSVLLATTIGAVLGPNLLEPSSALGTGIGLPPLIGAYLFGAVGFGCAAMLFLRHPGGAPPKVHKTTGHIPLGPTGITGIAVLAVANAVMVAVMTMAPVHMRMMHVGLAPIGLMVSLHIAGMFGPSPLSGRITEKWGAARSAALAGVVLAAASTLAALTGDRPAVLIGALLLLGAGWNLALVSGSSLLTARIPAVERPRRESWGEVSMGITAAVGGAGSGAVMVAGGYPLLAWIGAVVAAGLIIPAVTALRIAANPHWVAWSSRR